MYLEQLHALTADRYLAAAESRLARAARAHRPPPPPRPAESLAGERVTTVDHEALAGDEPAIR